MAPQGLSGRRITWSVVSVGVLALVVLALAGTYAYSAVLGSHPSASASSQTPVAPAQASASTDANNSASSTRGSDPASTGSAAISAPTSGDGSAPGSKTLTVSFGSEAPGWATLTLGAGTSPGILTIQVAGGSTSTASVDGPGPVRIDLSAPAGSHPVTISSTGSLGSVSIVVP